MTTTNKKLRDAVSKRIAAAVAQIVAANACSYAAEFPSEESRERAYRSIVAADDSADTAYRSGLALRAAIADPDHEKKLGANQSLDWYRAHPCRLCRFLKPSKGKQTGTCAKDGDKRGPADTCGDWEQKP